MLSALRSRGLMSVVYGVLIIGMALVFILGFNPSAGKQKASLGEACAARVKGHCVTPKDHMAAYRLLIPRGEQNEPLMAKAKQMNILRVSLDGLVERELLVNDADRLGITVTDDEVTDTIYDGFIHVSLPSDKVSMAPYVRVYEGKVRASFRDPKTKRFDLKVYERTIKAATGRSPTEFREEQAREILASKVRDLVRTPVRVSESEALLGYIDEKSTATLNTITVRTSYVAKYLAPAGQKDVDAWVAAPENQKAIDDAAEERKTPHIRHILTRVDAGASDAVKGAAKARLVAAIARVKKGESFAAVAKEVSQDPGSAAHGGDVGDRTDGFVAPFKEAADKLQPGEMTDAPVETQFGYHAILKDPVLSAAALRSLVAGELYAKDRAAKAAKGMADAIQAALRGGKGSQEILDQQIATLAPPAAPRPAAPDAKDAKGAPAPAAPGAADRPDTDPSRPTIVASSPFNRGGEPIEGLSPADNAKVIAFAFGAKDKDGMDEVLKAGEDYVLVALKDHKVATKDEFAKDKEVYLQTLVRQKEDEAFALYMKRLKDVAKSEIKIDEKYLADRMGTSKTADGGTTTPAEEEEEEGP
jgi:peptidyl-prolyl cis-trans isomerase D